MWCRFNSTQAWKINIKAFRIILLPFEMRYCARCESEKQTKKEREGGARKWVMHCVCKGASSVFHNSPWKLHWDEMRCSTRLCKNKKSQQEKQRDSLILRCHYPYFHFTFQIIDRVYLSGQMAAAYNDETKVFVQGDIVWIYGKWVVYPVASVHLLQINLPVSFLPTTCYRLFPRSWPKHTCLIHEK